MVRIVYRGYRQILALLLAAAVILAGLTSPVGYKAEASGYFHPTVVRGFNTSAFGDLKRAKEVFGANVFRLQLTPRTEAVRSGVPITIAWQRQLEYMEGALQEAARQGMYVIVDLHEPPLADPNLKTNTDDFWNNDVNGQLLVDSWKEIVQRFAPYRNNIWGYDLLNEPYNKSELPIGNEKWPVWAQQITDAIRMYDKNTPIIYEASPGALPRGFVENKMIDAGPGYPVKWQGDFPLLRDDKVIYSLHMYNPFAYSHQGLSTVNKAPVSTDWPDKAAYPGMINGTYWDKNKLIQDLQEVRDFQLKYNVPIYVGEFSAIRWAPGAAEYIRDLIEIFEEYGWSWTFHAYKEWHGWDPEYNEVMTSDANRDSAKAAEPTDRELVLKAYFSRNEFLVPNGEPSPPPNLVLNGTFEKDFNNDGLADRWGKDANAVAALVDINGSKAQKISTPSNQRGLDQAYFAVSDQNRYRLSAKIRVISGKIIFQHKDFDSNTGFLANGPVVSGLTNTGGDFVTKTLEFVPAPRTAKMSVGIWTEMPSEFIVDDVELIDLGAAVPVNPPKTVADVVYPGHLEFRAAAYDGAAVARTEYRIVGRSGGWSTVPNGGLTLNPPGNYIVAYRSVDTFGHTERAKSLLVDALAPTTTASLSPVQPDGRNGWYVHPVTVTLASYDNLSGVAATVYSLNGGTNWQPYSRPVSFTKDGRSSFTYRSTDRAGNIEVSNTIGIQLDATAPAIAVSSPVLGDHPDAGNLTVQFAVTDNLSGVDDSKTAATLDGKAVGQGTAIPLHALPLGTHILAISAADLAGNTGSSTVTFRTVTSISALKDLVTRFAQEGFIDNAGIAGSLQQMLDHNSLSSFVNEVQAQSGKHISSEAAACLLRDARFLMNQQ